MPVCFLVCVPVLAPFLASCATTPQTGDPADFTFFEKKETVPAGTKATLDFSFYLVDLSRPGDLQKLVRKTLYGGKSAADYQQRTSEEWKKEYKKFLTETDIPVDAMNWSYEEAHNIITAGTFAVIKKSSFSYKGGAHPNSYEKSLVLDLAAPVKQLSLRNIFTAEGLKRLPALTDRELRRYSQIRTGKALPAGTPLTEGIYLEAAIAPSEDFYPADNGLNFRWNRYEITPYAIGIVEISFRWDELMELLTPKGKEMAQAFQAKK